MLQTSVNFVMAWYNLPFTILLAICLLLAGLQWFGMGGDQETDADADADADLDADLDADVDADLDHDLDQDLDHDVEHDLDHDLGGQHAPNFSLLAYLGMGRAPLMVILLLLFGSVGLLGWMLNGLVLRSFSVYPGLLFGAVFGASLAGGGVVSSRIARVIGRALPPLSTTATPAQALVGRRGTVISPFVDQRYGMVHLRDSAGTLISVFAITAENPLIRRGEEVIFIHYDPDKRLYEVVRSGV